VEQFDNKIDLLIIPIRDEVIHKKGLDKNSTLTLLLLTDKNGKSARAALYISTIGRSKA